MLLIVLLVILVAMVAITGLYYQVSTKEEIFSVSFKYAWGEPLPIKDSKGLAYSKFFSSYEEMALYGAAMETEGWTAMEGSSHDLSVHYERGEDMTLLWIDRFMIDVKLPSYHTSIFTI